VCVCVCVLCVCVCVCVCVKRLPFLAFLIKAAKKLRASRAQAKKLVKKLRLVFSPMSPVS